MPVPSFIHSSERRRARSPSAALLVAVLATHPALAQGPTPAVTPPTVLTHVDAIYPDSALAAREHGDVVLALTVDVDGHVSKVDVLESGGAALDEAAIVAARQWTFSPARRGDRAVASRIRVPFHFAPPAPPPELVPEAATAEPALAPQSAAQRSRAATRAEPSRSAPAELAQEVTVTGRQTAPSRGVSDFQITTGELSRVPRQNSSDLLKLAPGVLLTNEGGEGHAEQVFLRGFDASEAQDLEMSVGGVPINESGNLHGNGYADTHFIIPELVESLRVVEGPFDPRQGNFAVAGSAEYQLGLARRGLTAKFTGGSFGTERLLLTWGPKEESTRTFAAAELYSTDSFGQNRDARRGTAMAQYEGRLGKSGSYRVGATAYSTDYHAAGVVREEDYRAGRIGFYDSYALSSFARDVTRPGGDASRYSVSGDVESRHGDTTLSQQVYLLARDMRLIENFTGFLLDPRGDTLDLSMHEVTFGARGSSSFSGKVLGQKQVLELGYFARGDRVRGQQQRLDAATGNPYATETSLDASLGDLGLYADASVKPLSLITLRGGVRADLFTFDVNQHASTASTAIMPRASVILGPYRHFSLTASYGKGVRSADPTDVIQDRSTPFASVNAYEGGLLYAGAIGDAQLTARSLFFQTKASKDILFSENTGRNELTGGTTRTGWVGAARLTALHVDESFNVTLVRSTYDATHELVPYAPDLVLRSDSAYVSELPFRLSGSRAQGSLGAGVSYVAPRPLPFGERSNSIFTVDLSATVSVSHYELGLYTTNLLGSRYRLGEYDYSSSFDSTGARPPTLAPARHFTAGAPRGVFATLTINFGGV